MKTTSKILLCTLVLISIAVIALVIAIRINMEKYSSLDEINYNNEKIISKRYSITGFKKIKLVAPCNVRIKRSSEYSIEVIAAENTMKNLKMSKSGERLVLSLGRLRRDNRKIIAEISMPGIEELDIVLPSTVTISGFGLDFLKIAMSGAGKVTGINNRIEKLEITSQGASDINFSKSEVVNARLTASGATRINLNMAGGILEGNLSGVSSVTYSGTIIENRLIASGASVIKRKS